MKKFHLSTYISFTISILVISSIFIISGILYFSLNKSLTTEFEDRVKAQCGEATQILSGRFHRIRNHLKELALDNTIRVTLMLGVYQQLEQYLNKKYSEGKSTRFCIKPLDCKTIFKTSNCSMGTKEAEKILVSSGRKGILKRLKQYGFVYCLSYPVIRHNAKIGTAGAIYILKNDTALQHSICGDKDCSVIRVENGRAWDLFTGKIVKGFNDFKVKINNIGLSYILLNNEKTAVVKNKEFPDLLYVSKLNKLNNAKMRVLKPVIYSAAFVLILTIIVSLFLSRLLGMPLFRLSQAALKIAEGKSFSVQKNIFSNVIEIDQLMSSLSIMVDNLRKTERLKSYRQLFEGVADPVFIYDFSGKILDVNKIAVDQFGFSKREFENKALVKMVPVKHREKISGLIEKLLETGKPVVFETEIYTKNNILVYIECHAKKIVFKGQNAVLSVARDITKRKKAQQDLIKSEERLSLALEVSLAITWEFDLKTKKFTIDTGNFKLPGYGKKDIKNIKNTLKLIHPENVNKAKHRFNKFIKGITSCYYDEFPVVTENGEQRWFHNRARIIKYDDKHKPLIIIGTAIDISELKQAEQALRNNEERYRTILDNRNIGYFEVDLNGNMTFFNDAMCEIFGYSPDELFGMNYRAYTDDKTSKKIKEKYDTILKTGLSLKNFEYSARTRSGDLVEIEASVSLKKDLKGQPCGFRGLIIDITDRKNAEREKEKLEMELRQSHKMEAIGTLAGGIAHDFNNILSGIFGYCQLAEMNINNPVKAKACISQVFMAAKRAAGLIQQILTFTRRTDHKKHPLNISIVVKEALKLIRSSIPSTIEIKENIVSNMPVIADPTQIHQVVMNLCTNAYHAMRDKGGILEIELKDIEISEHKNFSEINNMASGRYIHLKVSDTGHGMDERILEKIFDPYFSTKKPGEGTGLGLALVYAIVEDHKGHIKVYSTPGKGSEFHVFLPAIKQNKVKRNVTDKTQVLRGGKESVMFVDDEQSILESARELLFDYGYDVMTFSNGADAFEEFKQNPDKFDLVITDMTMPRMTGDKLAIEILKIKKDIPVILCTGYNENISEKKAIQLGIKRYVQKPMGGTGLISLIREVLDN